MNLFGFLRNTFELFFLQIKVQILLKLLGWAIWTKGLLLKNIKATINYFNLLITWLLFGIIWYIPYIFRYFLIYSINWHSDLVIFYFMTKVHLIKIYFDKFSFFTVGPPLLLPIYFHIENIMFVFKRKDYLVSMV